MKKTPLFPPLASLQRSGAHQKSAPLTRNALLKSVALSLGLAVTNQSPSLLAADDTWDGGGDGVSWQDNGNWVTAFPGTAGDVFTTTDQAIFSTAGSGTIDLGGFINIRNINFGVGAGDAAAFVIGDANDTLNLSNSASGISLMGAGVTTTEQTGSAGTTIRLDTTAGSVHIFTNNSATAAAKFNIGGNITTAAVTGASRVTLNGTNGGTVSGTITNGGGTATMGITKSGAGAWTLSGANTYSGGTIVRQGQLTLSGSAKTHTGAQILVVDNNLASTFNARLNISSNVTALQMFIGDRATVGQTGAVYQTAGTTTLTQAASVDNLRIGSVANGWGYYNLSGGTLITNEVGIGASLAGTAGVMDITGGTFTDNGFIAIGRGTGISSGLLNVTGGSATGVRIEMGYGTTAGAQAVLNVGGGGSAATVSTTASATLGLNLLNANVAGTQGIANLLTNGTLTVGRVFASGGTNPTALLNFNGGTLKATATTNAGATFLTDVNIDRVDVYSAGGTVDNNNTAITISRPLTAPTGSGVSTIAVTTKGTGYVGAPLLKITGGTGNGATAIANMVDDGTGNGTFRLDSITNTSPGVYTVAPTAVGIFGGNPGGTAAVIGAISTTANVSGGMTFTGAGTTTLTGANTYSGGTQINGGTVATSISGTLGTGNVTIADTVGVTLTLGSAVSFGDSAILTFGATNSVINMNFSGDDVLGGITNGAFTIGNGTYTTVQLNDFFADGVFGGASATNFADLGTLGETLTVVPEPSAFAMALASLGILLGIQRSRRRA